MAIYGKRAADAMSRAAKLEHARAAETVRYNAVQAYEGLVLANAYESVMQAALASADGHVRQAEAMVENEMATEADLLQARVYRDGLRQKLIEIRNMVASAGDEHPAADGPVHRPAAGPGSGRRGRHPTRRPSPDAPRTGPTSRPPAPRPPPRRACRGWRAAPCCRTSTCRPRRTGSTTTTCSGNEADSWTVGVYATWDVFAGLENVGALRKARAQSRAAQHMADFKLRQARTEQSRAAQDLNAATEKLQVAQDAVASARESLRIVTDMYREGLASMVDLLDVQAAATAAEGNLVQARHDVNVGEATLIYAGAIDPDAEEDGRP